MGWRRRNRQTGWESVEHSTLAPWPLVVLLSPIHFRRQREETFEEHLQWSPQRLISAHRRRLGGGKGGGKKRAVISRIEDCCSQIDFITSTHLCLLKWEQGKGEDKKSERVASLLAVVRRRPFSLSEAVLWLVTSTERLLSGQVASASA